MLKESDIRKRFIKEIKNKVKDEIYFSNPSGLAFQGITKGDKLIIKRKIAFGLQEGSSDFIGIKKIKITEEDIGKEYGLFIALEIKSPTGRMRKNQKEFKKLIEEYGGKYILYK